MSGVRSFFGLSGHRSFAIVCRVRHSLGVKPRRIRLFIKPYCGWCHKAMRWLNAHGVEYETIDVTTDESAMAEMVRLTGQELAPVIEVDGQLLVDFGPEQLAEFWKKINV